MKAKDVPFWVTVLACLLPLPAAYLNSKTLSYTPELLLTIAYLYWLSKARKAGKKMLLGGGWILVLYFVAIHGTIQLVTTGGNGSLGSISVVITTLIFIQFLSIHYHAPDPRRLAWQLAAVYLLHIGYLYFELISRMAGFSDIYVSLFGNATDVTIYKTYNSAMFLSYIGFDESFWGLNGLLLGSQSAGQVMLCSVVLFAPWYKWGLLTGKKNLAVFMLAGLGVLFAINMTSAMLFALVVIFMIFIVPASKVGGKLTMLLVVSLVVLFQGEIIKLLFFRVQAASDIETYRTAFLPPVEALREMTWFQILFGLGRYVVLAKATDFGVGMLANQMGILWVVIFTVALFNLVFRAFRESRVTVCHLHALSAPDEAKAWVWLAVVNALLVMIWALSLVHYTPAIELGGRQLFAFHCAVTYVAVGRQRLLRKVEHLRTERMPADGGDVASRIADG